MDGAIEKLAMRKVYVRLALVREVVSSAHPL
jgi:hypothetical protein